jgi:DNA-binding transcriptional MerR regulator
MAYTIKEIADLAGVTTRTLRYYDEIGLLLPERTGANGYRYYGHTSLLRLQQILFFRELDVPLKDIQLLLDHPDFNLLTALEDHRASLQKRVNRLNTLIETIDYTMSEIKGESNMSAEEYFVGFDETKYEDEVIERWGHTDQYAESQRKWSSYSKDQKDAIKAERGRLTVRMVSEDPRTSPDAPDVQAAIGEYLAYLNKYFYTCDVRFLRRLSDIWVADPRFAVNYECIRTGGTEFVREAVHIYCDRCESGG